jgi:hypothetical protein
MAAEMPDWETFRTLCNHHGTTLAETREKQGFSAFEYHGIGVDGTQDTCDNTAGNECSDYLVVFEVLGVEHNMIGSRIIVTSPGIYRQSF